MNSFLFNIVALCLAAQCALAQYQSAPAYGYNSQRKTAPSPQTYAAPSYAGEQQHQQASYGAGAESGSSYEQPQQQPAYRAPSSSYGRQQSAPSYGRQQAAPAASYGQQAASYAKAAPKYEEPYYPPMPFAWGYDINDGYGGAQYHKENGDEYGKRTGSYGYTDAYGIYRQVDYVADEHGFRATIKTNEPGTANESPADVELHAYEPPSNYYSGKSSGAYGGQQQQASYGAGQSSSYGAAAPAAAASSSYSAGPRAHSQPQQSYAPQRSSYANTKQQAGPSYSRQQAGYEQAAQYSSSVIVPVYQRAAPVKVAPSAAAPAKRY